MVVTFVLTTSPGARLVMPVTVSVHALPFGIAAGVHDGAVFMTAVLKPAFDVVPWTTMDPRVTETEPTFRTITVLVPFVPVVKTAISMATLDCAAMFCAPCCPPVALDV